MWVALRAIQSECVLKLKHNADLLRTLVAGAA